jgi:hypothetical protein
MTACAVFGVIVIAALATCALAATSKFARHRVVARLDSLFIVESPFPTLALRRHNNI